jgi:acyl carrier protein
MSTQPATVETIQVLIEQLRPEAPPMTPMGRETRFVADLGLASLELIGLVFLCEQAFSVSLISEPGLLATLHTVGQTVDALRQLQGLRSCEPALSDGLAASTALSGE